MRVEQLQKVIQAIDKYNGQDPRTEEYEGKQFPQEVLYSMRMTDCLKEYEPSASPELHIAARAQHIGRWEIPRESYPQDRKGYLKGRNALKAHHANLATHILESHQVDGQTIARVSDLLQKKSLKKNPETQILEDVICFVFLKYYAAAFSAKHEEAKMISILRKTWRKMSERGQQTAQKLELIPKVKHLVVQAIT